MAALMLKLPEPLIEVTLRASAALAGLWFVVNAWLQWRAAPTRLTLPLIVIGEMTTVLLLLCSRVPKRRDWHPLSCLCTLVATYYFIAVRLAPGAHLLPESAGSAMQCIGLIWALLAKLSLRGSFGMLPANRGVVSSGVYRWTRHPMYTGYFVSHMGFLLANFGAHNVLLFTALYVAQGWRVWSEERLLARDPAYRRYMQRVRYRVLPGVF